MPPTRLVLSSSLLCPAPMGQVRSIFEDAARWTEWCSVVREVHATPGSWAAGARLHYVLLAPGGIPVAFDVRLTRVTEAEIAWTSVRGPIRGTRTWSFVERDGGVEVTDTKVFESTWLPVAFVYPRFVVRRMSEQWLADLKEVCTAPSPGFLP